MSQYVSLGQPRFRIEHDRGREQLRIPAQGSLFVTAFLSVWLCGWTAGGVAAISAFSLKPNAFLGFWLCGWALGWCFAALLIAWRLTGSEILRPVGFDLEVERRILGLSRRRLYRGTDIRNLRAYAPQAPGGFWSQNSWNRTAGTATPFFYAERWGRVSFDYGSRSVYLAGGLDDAESREMVEWLGARLPKSARAEAG